MIMATVSIIVGSVMEKMIAKMAQMKEDAVSVFFSLFDINDNSEASCQIQDFTV